ncbi:ankyrin repeat-containing protein ITN1-like [Cannabis sativa]|uniref:ankyrin repeat-containing protein ITN1-like n=1 Tax=Cannabis sativa TaxID=3483 RepID=UPI0029CA7F58|nr:ankyrin repeat-containing protein ITN1-like [Cannabis sativa]XP_030503212.2 ankyrin repeat-containing protein ITN1-like [Cannabis sativa]
MEETMLSGSEFDEEVADIRSSIVNKKNEMGEMALFIASEKGHLEVVKELMQYLTKEGISIKNLSGFDPFHIAASQDHKEIILALWEFTSG